MKQKNIKSIIKSHFFINPNAKLRVREIERTLQIPLPSVIRYCKELAKEQILTTIKTGNVTFFTADKTSTTYLLHKKLFNVQQLYESNFIEYLRRELSNPNVIVFGSYAKGDDIETSDIDIYIEAPAQKELSLEKFERTLHRKIQVFLFKDIHAVKNKNLANNIINGVILNGFVEVFT